MMKAFSKKDAHPGQEDYQKSRSFSSFLGPDGECLFLGASGSKRGNGDWEITFRFAANSNKTSLTVGDIAGISKNAWEYLWFRYEDAVDGAAGAVVKKPLAVYIEKVCDEGDFSGLAIGTTRAPSDNFKQR